MHVYFEKISNVFEYLFTEIMDIKTLDQQTSELNN